jgi:hypothetical protein
MRSLALGLLFAWATSITGCASITRGTDNQVQFDSEPSGAEVRTVIIGSCDASCIQANAGDRDTRYSEAEPEKPKEGPACVTPCVVTVARKDVLIATFTKAGYHPEIIKIDTRVAGEGAAAMAGNLVVGGVVGGVIDAGTGATLEHFPNPAKAILRPITAPARTARKPAARRARP